MDARWQPAANKGWVPERDQKLALGENGKPPRDPGLDPYLRWARHTKWRGFRRSAQWVGDSDASWKVRVIAKAADRKLLEAAVRCAELDVSDVYAQFIPGTQKHALHFTATLAFADLQWLAGNPLRLRWKLALPLRDAEAASRLSPKGLFGPDRDRAELYARQLVAEAIEPLQPLKQQARLGAAIAVVDAGCPFLHDSFESVTQGTRVAAIWDQGSDPMDDWPDDKLERLKSLQPGWPWRMPKGFNTGRELVRDALDAIATCVRRRQPALDETDVYRGIDFMLDYEDARRRTWFATHGGHVLSMAAGKPDPLRRQRPPAEQKDPAQAADLVFVQLPMQVAMDSGGGSLAPHLLDGVRYAMSLMKEPDSPLVVNISYGGQAGPHDGSSLIEGALDELIERRRNNFAVVLAAGNSRETACHAKRQLRPGYSVMLRLAVPAGDSTDSFVEIWYAAPREKHWQVQCRARTPGHDWGPWVQPGHEVLLRETSTGREVVAMLRHDRVVPNGARSMILFGLGPTALPPEVPGALCEPGEWAIELRLHPVAAAPSAPAKASPPPTVDLDAWIERDDPSPSSVRPIAAFLDQDANDDIDTCSSIASGRHTVTVGGFNLQTDEEAAYSARGQRGGASGGTTPVVLAACEEDSVTPTIAAAATRSADSYRLNGTSVAAPVLARRLFNALSKGKTPSVKVRARARKLADGQDPALKLPK
jgi:Subtilase family